MRWYTTSLELLHHLNSEYRFKKHFICFSSFQQEIVIFSWNFKKLLFWKFLEFQIYISNAKNEFEGQTSFYVSTMDKCWKGFIFGLFLA